MYTKKSLHGIISVHFHQRRSEFAHKLTKFYPKSWNQKESVQESIQESKGIGFSSQHQGCSGSVSDQAIREVAI